MYTDKGFESRVTLPSTPGAGSGAPYEKRCIINLTYPIFASVIAAIWLKEKLSRAAMLWMAVGFCGLVVFLSDNGQLMRPSPYDWLALAGAVGSGWVVVSR